MLYPFVVYVLRRWLPKEVFSYFLLAGMVGSFVDCVHATQLNAGLAYYSPMPRFWEFLVGGLVACLHASQSSHTRRGTPVSLQLLVLIALAMSFHFTDKTQFPGWWALIPVMCAALIIADKSPSFVNTALSSSGVQFVGNISYSLYLWHWPVFSYMSMTLAVDRPLSAVEKLVGLVVSVVLAALSYRWVELSVKRKSGAIPNKKLLTSWVSVSAVAIAGLVVVLTNPNEYKVRLPSYLGAADLALNDRNPRIKECFLEGDKARQNGFRPSFCKIGNSRGHAPQAILWGDSFSDALQPAVDEALGALQLSGVVSAASGCPPVEGVPYVNEAMQHQFRHCGQGLGVNTLNYIRQTPSLNLVLMHANWSRYNAVELNRDLVPEICELKKLGKAVVLIGQVPQPSYNTPRYWGSLQMKERHPVEQIAFSQSESLPLNATFDALVKEVTSACGEVTTLNPYDTLCAQDLCYSVKNGKALFRDEAHLSNAGASLLQVPLQAVLSQLMRLHQWGV